MKNKTSKPKLLKVNDLQAAAQNPRKVTNARLSVLRRQLVEFGDLGGIVFNRVTNELVSGHQRVKEFERVKAEIMIERTIDPPSLSGTVAEGFIKIEGERFGYREVLWDKKKAAAALLAANNHAGEWDDDQVRSLLQELDVDQREMSGFEHAFLEELSKPIPKEGHGGFGEDEEKPKHEQEIYIAPIALTSSEWREWLKVKEALGCKRCKEAFLKLMQKGHEDK